MNIPIKEMSDLKLGTNNSCPPHNYGTPVVVEVSPVYGLKAGGNYVVAICSKCGDEKVVSI